MSEKPAPRGDTQALRATSRERSVTNALLFGATVLIAGLFLVGSALSDAGKLLVVAGVIILAGGIHYFGRLGPEGWGPEER